MVGSSGSADNIFWQTKTVGSNDSLTGISLATESEILGENDVIMGMPGLGRQLHAAITLIDDGGTKFQTYATAAVPSYSVSKDDNTIALTVRSRFLLVPDISTGWRYARVKQ